MSRALKVSGFVGLTVQMLWGLGNVYMLMPGHGGVPPASVGAHAHFGVLGILAVVAGFAVDRYELSGTRRTATVWAYIAGQWLLPLTVLSELFFPPLLITAFLWGALLAGSMGSLALAALNGEPSPSRV